MKLTKISSRQNEKVLELLGRRQDYYFFEGEKLVRDVIRIGKADLLVAGEEHEKELYALQDSAREIWLASSQVLKKISSLSDPPTLVAVYKNLASQINFSSQNTVIALFEIQDPGNLGTIFRSALAFGIRNIALLGGSVRLNNSKFLRAAQTALFQVNWQFFKNAEQLLKKAERQHYNIYLTDSRRGREIVATGELQQPALIFFGSEGQGLPAEMFLNYPVLRIDQSEAIDSLNVGVASSIVFYELKRKNRL